jgi:branched-chain amino acid transport system substrate-binding protein
VGLAAEYANQSGGWHGRPFQLQLEHADSWDAAPFAVERLAQRGITTVMGSYGSTISRPAAEAASRLGILFWETGAVGQLGMGAASGRLVFRFAPTGESLGRAAVRFVRDVFTPRLQVTRSLRYTVAYVDDVYGRAVAEGAIEEVKRSGLPLAATLPYTPPAVDFDALAQRVAQARTDVLVVAAYLGDAVAMRRALVRAKVPLLASIGTSSSYCHLAFGEMLAEDAVGLFASDKPNGDILRLDGLVPDAEAALQWARTAYHRRYTGEMSAATLAGFAGGIALFRHVFPLAADLSPTALARAATQVNLAVGALPNGSGLLFAPAGQPGAGANLNATSVIWQWVRPRTRAVVWPPVFATHSLVLR